MSFLLINSPEPSHNPVGIGLWSELEAPPGSAQWSKNNRAGTDGSDQTIKPESITATKLNYFGCVETVLYEHRSQNPRMARWEFMGSPSEVRFPGTFLTLDSAS
jgi:hypothetical protein